MIPMKPTHVLMLLLAVLAPLGAEGARRRAVSHPGLPAADALQGGYANRTSVFQGNFLTLHIASTVQPLTVEIVNLADPDHVLTTIENLTSRAQSCSEQSAGDCNWDATTTITVPYTWPSGYYAARFPTAAGERWAPFIVRSAQPGSQILVLSSTHTMQAYNRFGGSGVVERVSYQRPYSQHDGLGGYSDDEQLFVDWLTAEGLPFEVASDVDLEDPTLLSRYNVVVIPGRAEFWTAQARANLEQFNRNGGHVAVLNGNTMWWQVHLEDDHETIVGTEHAGNVPAFGPQPQLAAPNWFEHPITDPETRFFGSSFLYGGFANRGNGDSLLPVEQRTGWTVMAPNHWIYSGTSLGFGSTFGRETVGLEVGGTLFNCDANGTMVGIDPSAGTPLNFQILAWTPASEGTGTIGIYTNPAGGAVFNAGTQRWVHGLQSDETVRQMTRNVIEQFATGDRLPHTDTVTMMLTEEKFNCQQYTLHALPGWKQPAAAPAKVTARCAYEGAAGVELSGPKAIEMIRDFTPTAEPHHEIGARFYINVASYVGKADGIIARVALRNTAGAEIDEPTAVEFEVSGGKTLTRLMRRDVAGNITRSGTMELSSGWHLIWLTWHAPGETVLQLDKIPTQTLDNPDTDRIAGEIVLEYPQPTRADDGSFVCIDALAVGNVKPGSLPAQ
jgi:hypothetical protein